MVENEIYVNDLENILKKELPWEKIEGKTFFITGATGLIGSCLVDLLMRHNKANVICSVRNLKKAEDRFCNYLYRENFSLFEYNLKDKLSVENQIDYIIHLASGANPFEFTNHPVETISDNFFGTYNLLEYAKENNIKRFMYVSSGEVYGEAVAEDTVFTEEYVGTIDSINVRSCYPISKKASEVLCASYLKECGVDSVIVRPCHIYGPTMTETDSRVSSYLIRLAVNNEDLLLKSDGKTVRSNCYIVDAISGLMHVLLLGKEGDAYNIASDKESSILEFAQTVSQVARVKVVFDIDKKIEKRSRAVLSNEKLKALGWREENNLFDGISKTINILKKAKIH